MKIQPLVNFVALLMLLEATIACGFPSTYANNQPHSSPTPIMTNNTGILKKVTLMAREENLPLLGIPDNPQRNIGFASVFVGMENHQLTPITVILTKVEIRNLADSKLQNFQLTLQKIHLKPLENSKVVFQLANKTGYSGQDQVKAIITYQIGEQLHVIESESVEIDRH